MNHAYVKITNVLNADGARDHARHKLVCNNDKLLEEFYESLGKDWRKISVGEHIAAMDDFIKRKNFKIVSEKPMVRLDTEKNWYRVDVVYTFEV